MSKANSVYGLGQGLIRVLPLPVAFENAPTSADTNWEVGQVVFTPGPLATSFYMYAGAGIWTFLASAGGDLSTLTTDDSTIITPTAGNINLKGTGSITTIGSGSNATVELTGLTNHALLVGAGTATITKLAVGASGTLLSGTGVDPAFTASPSVSGSLTAGTTITATLGNITATNGNLVLGTAGNKLSIATGSNASCGVSGNMTGTPGAVTVSTSACTASSIILYSRATTGGTPGQVSITAQSTSGFTLTSTGNETSTFYWVIIN